MTPMMIPACFFKLNFPGFTSKETNLGCRHHEGSIKRYANLSQIVSKICAQWSFSWFTWFVCSFVFFFSQRELACVCDPSNWDPCVETRRPCYLLIFAVIRAPVQTVICVDLTLLFGAPLRRRPRLCETPPTCPAPRSLRRHATTGGTSSWTTRGRAAALRPPACSRTL